jgi:hypothetical protein
MGTRGLYDGLAGVDLPIAAAVFAVCLRVGVFAILRYCVAAFPIAVTFHAENPIDPAPDADLFSRTCEDVIHALARGRRQRRVRREGSISQETLRRLQRELDLEEARLTSGAPPGARGVRGGLGCDDRGPTSDRDREEGSASRWDRGRREPGL